MENRVVRQDPAGGVKAEPGSTVTIWVGRFVPPSAKKQKGPKHGPGRRP
jgi:beta-lactam-binding protein with PASTA domain